MQPASPELLSASAVAIRDCLGARPGERVLIVTDRGLRPIAAALHRAAEDLGHDVLLVEMLPRRGNGEEPPVEVAALMTQFDVVLCPASTSLTHTAARRAATAAGARIATLPGVTEDIMVRCMNADYAAIAARTNRLCSLLAATTIVRVRAAGGTDLTLPVAGRTPLASTGLLRERGQWGNLPTGEAYLAPREGESHGVLVVDGSMASIGLTAQPIRIEIADGYAAGITGGEPAERLRSILDRHGRQARNVAEFGIGTNDRAKVTGIVLEDEKVMGTIHVAFGDNKSMGGSVAVPSHLDGVVLRPTVWFDDRLIVEEGEMLV